MASPSTEHHPLRDCSSTLPKDTAVQVDYFTHQWDETDLESSWKVLTKKKNDIVNGTRLENASWRTWAKQRNKLKTLRPETLNWLKDNDVTWLYGPLHTLKPIPKPAPYSTSVVSKLQRLNLKSVLKRPPPEDIFGIARNPSKWTTPIVTRLMPSSQSEMAFGSVTAPVSPLNSPVTPDLLGSSESKSTSRQRIRFNQKVEQCIAIDSEDEGIESDSSSWSSSTLETPYYRPPYFGNSSLSNGSSRTASVESFDDLSIFPPHSRMNDGFASSLTSSDGDGDDDAIHFGRRSSNHSSATSTTSHIPLPIIVKLQPTTLKSDSIAKPAPEPFFLRDGTCNGDDEDSDFLNSVGGSSSWERSTSFLASLFLQYNHGKFDPDRPLSPHSNATDLNSGSIRTLESSKALRNGNGYRHLQDEEPRDVKAYGIVDQCQDIVINVADVVRWCGSIVFNSIMF